MKKPLLVALTAVTLLIVIVYFYGRTYGKDAYCTKLLEQASDTSSSTATGVREMAVKLLVESYVQCKPTLEYAALNKSGNLQDNALFMIAYNDNNPERINIFISVLQNIKGEDKNTNQLSVLTSIFRNGQNLSKPMAVKALLNKVTPGRDRWNLRLYKVAVDLDPAQSMGFLQDLISKEDRQVHNENLPISDFLSILAKSENVESRKFAEAKLRETK